MHCNIFLYIHYIIKITYNKYNKKYRELKRREIHTKHYKEISDKINKNWK